MRALYQAHTSSGLRRWRAFSLIELVLVVAIISILSAIAMPRVGGAIARQRVDAAARRVVMDLALARRSAELANASRTAAFLPAQAKYTLTGVQPLDGVGTDYVVILKEEPYGATIVSADFGGDPDLVFDVFGRPDSDGSVVIQVGNEIRTVSVDPDTGLASFP